MPYTDKIVYANNGVGTADGATPSTSPALPTVFANGLLRLYNGTGTDTVAANNRIRFGTKFTFNGTTGGSNMFALPTRQSNKIIAEHSVISTADLTELYVDIVNYSSSDADLTASQKLYDMLVLPKRCPFKLAIS